MVTDPDGGSIRGEVRASGQENREEVEEGVGLPVRPGARQEPWIETAQGGLFFINALLVAPELVVLFPLTLQLLVGLIAEERAASPFLDTIPFVALKAIPFLGWFLVIPIWTTVKNLKMKGLLLPRVALGIFLLIHLCFLGYTILSWV